jgi:hypothetical protein
LEELAKKAEDRVQKLTAKGLSVVSLKTQLDSAKAKIATAKTIIATSKTAIEGATTDTVGTGVIRDALSKATIAEKEVRRAVTDLLAAFRVEGKIPPISTTTPITTN